MWRCPSRPVCNLLLAIATAVLAMGVLDADAARDDPGVCKKDPSHPRCKPSAPTTTSGTGTSATSGSSDTTASSGTTSTSSSSPSSGSARLAWAPPTLSSPLTVTVTNANRRLFLDRARDYVLVLAEPLKRELWIEGGNDVVVVGGRITVDAVGTSGYHDRTAVKVRYSTGVVHLEGLLIDGPYVGDGIGLAAPQAIVQVQNVRVEGVVAIGGEHPDCVQSQEGVGGLRVDRFTCRTQLQGFFLGDHDGPIGRVDIRNANIVGAGGRYLFWQTTAAAGPISLANVWLQANDPAWTDFGKWVWPNRNAEGQTDPSRRAVVSADGSYLWFQNSNISGRIEKGRPVGGDFVPAGSVGAGYVTPGYAN